MGWINIQRVNELNMCTYMYTHTLTEFKALNMPTVQIQTSLFPKVVSTRIDSTSHHQQSLLPGNGCSSHLVALVRESTSEKDRLGP